MERPERQDRRVATLPLGKIERDENIQQRAGGMHPARIREYAKAMSNGDTFPPVTVFEDNEGRYWLADGFHRCAAAELESRAEINVEIFFGTRRHALLYAVGANAAHGIRRTNADKRKAVLTLLEDEEWHQWSDHEISRRTHTTQPFVSKLRRQQFQTSSGNGPALRKSIDGRIIDTARIGEKKFEALKRAWNNAGEEVRRAWVSEIWDEIRTFLRPHHDSNRVGQEER